MKKKSDKKSRKKQPKTAKEKNTDKSVKKANQKERKETKCFSCRSSENKARDYPHKDEGPKCLSANFGLLKLQQNVITLVRQRRKNRKVNVINMSNRVPTDNEIIINDDDTPIISMMDTGIHYAIEVQRISVD